MWTVTAVLWLALIVVLVVQLKPKKSEGTLRRMSWSSGCGVSRFGVEWKIDYEFVEPDNRALALAVLFEEDDSQLCKPTEFLVNVLYVPINGSSGFVDARRLFPADCLDKFEDTRGQRRHEIVVAGK